MSMRLTPAVVAALRTGLYPIAPLIEVRLPRYTLRHVVGAAEVPWNNQRFVGEDAKFGALVSAGDLKDGIGDEAPDWDLTFTPPNDAAVDDLAGPEQQGSAVFGWLAVIDRVTGLPLPDPLLLFAGELDVPRLRAGKSGRTLEWRCTSALEVFHETETGARLSDAWHKLVWPGETGLANMSGIDKTSYWGVEKLPSGVTYGSGGGGGSTQFSRAVQAA